MPPTLGGVLHHAPGAENGAAARHLRRRRPLERPLAGRGLQTAPPQLDGRGPQPASGRPHALQGPSRRHPIPGESPPGESRQVTSRPAPAATLPAVATAPALGPERQAELAHRAARRRRLPAASTPRTNCSPAPTSSTRNLEQESNAPRCRPPICEASPPRSLYGPEQTNNDPAEQTNTNSTPPPGAELDVDLEEHRRPTAHRRQRPPQTCTTVATPSSTARARGRKCGRTSIEAPPVGAGTFRSGIGGYAPPDAH